MHLEKKARARDGDVDAAERRRKGKAPCLEPPAAAADAEAGPSRGGGRVSLEATDPSEDPGDWEVVAIRDTDGEECGHISCDMDEIADIESGMAARGDPMCEHETCLATGSHLVMVCPECGWCFCIGGLANRAKPRGHIREHAYRRAHWVALRCEDPCEGYCFACEDSLAIESQRVADGGEEGYGCVVTGIPNLGNTCYLNALLQCLLVLGKLRARMFGPGAPLGVLGDLLHDLFVDTNSASYARGLLDPMMLLRCVRSRYSQFQDTTMQDCHELLCCLRDGLDEEERKGRAGKMQQGAPSAVAPTVIDSIFVGQLSVTLSCKCCSFKSDSEEVFHDLSMPLPPKGTPAKSVASPPQNERRISQQKTHMELFPEIDKTSAKKIHAISEGGDAQVSASESEYMVMVKTSEPLEVDSNHLEQISQSKGDVHGPLQAPTRKENMLIASGHDVEGTVSAVLDSMRPEDSIEAKMDTLSAEVATEDKEKDRNRDVVYDKADDINSLASIEEILELHFKAEMIEKRCENCSNASQKASPISGKHGEQMVACTNVNRTVHGDQDEQDQGRGKQVNIGHSAHQVEENQYDRPDRDKRAIKTCRFSKLPPVLALHLKRNSWPLKLKVSGHVSFKEILDVKLFMHPSSEDKDNSSYRLVGVVEHRGPSMNAGHFVAYVRPSRPQQTNGSSLWFCASDADIREVSLEEVLKSRCLVGDRALADSEPSPRAMGEEKRARVAGDRATVRSPRKGKAPRIESPPAILDADDSGWGGDASLEVYREAAAVATRGGGGERCEHMTCSEHDVAEIVSKIASWGDPVCQDETCMCTGRHLMMVCVECDMHFCIGRFAKKAKPRGHIEEHAFGDGHWVALWYEDPYTGYCFECEDPLTIGGEEGEKGMKVKGEEGRRASGSDSGHGCVIRGIPNHGNTCYLNAVLQCLLVLGKLRARMSGPDAPLGMLGRILHDLFVATESVSYTRDLLDPTMLLDCARSYKSELQGNTMQDSHELLCCLRDSLNEEESITGPDNMQQGAPSAVVPTVIDSIFYGQLLVTTLCKYCSFESVSQGPQDAFYDLCVALPPRNERCMSQQKIAIEQFPAIDKTNTEKIHAISGGGDPQVPASELGDMVMVKTSEPLVVDSNPLDQIAQSKDDVHCPLQSPIRKENVLITSDRDVERTNSAVLNSLKPEDSVEAKMDTLSAEVTTEDEGKDRNCDAVYDEADYINSLASIEEILDFHFKAQMVEKRCENCSNVAQKASPISGKDGEQTVDGDQAEQSERKTCQSEQPSDSIRCDGECSSSSRQPHVADAQHQVMPTEDITTKGDISGMSRGENDSLSCNIVNKKSECLEGAQEDVPDCTQDQGRRKQVNLHQVEKNEGAIQTSLISKLPPVLVIQLKRNTGFVKVRRHVSFKEILDVGLFLHPSSEDKDNSSYRLAGVIEHLGPRMDAGHYVAYVRPSPPQQINGSSSWFRASDTDITEVSLEEVLRPSPQS
uniref:Ubiquitinyl hydrolase 1 n=1 Tax=Oryza punctata TaxID=4537 RepID=A0A0E0LX55_ORYPU